MTIYRSINAGRLTDTGGSRAGIDPYRHYTYDKDTNRTTRCVAPSSAPVCEAAPDYDFADKMTSGPGRPSIDYDTHGNITHYTRTGGAADVNITYDDYDHATVINDGTTKTEEWLTPSGRVLHRKVTQLSNNSVTSNIVFGYSDDSDSPAWAQPASGGTVTTYIGDATIVGATVIYQATNLHGDVIGTVDAAGAFTDLPDTDEFGVTDGTIPSARLGWLGGSKRFAAAPALDIVRMGVRLYDPNLGRFLQADPIIGGSCNTYDYVCGDPINKFDIPGTGGSSGGHCGSLRGHRLKHCMKIIRKRHRQAMRRQPAGAFNLNFNFCLFGCWQATIAYDRHGINIVNSAGGGGAGRGLIPIRATISVTRSNKPICERSKVQYVASGSDGWGASGSMGSKTSGPNVGELDSEDWEAGPQVGVGFQTGAMRQIDSLSTC